MAKTIADYKKDYEEARKNGDAAGMQAANDGANAIRKAQGQAVQSASQDIANTASKNSTSTSKSSGTSNRVISSGSSGSAIRYNDDDDDDDGGYRSSSSGTYDPSKPQGAQMSGVAYDDVPDRPLDSNYYQKESYYKQMYETARASGDVEGMRAANDGMNQIRNDYGLAAQSANSDISYIKGVTGYGSSSGGSGGSYGSYGGGYELSQPEDLSDYLNQMYEAQRQAAIAQIRNAYNQNIGAIDKSAIGIDAQYQNARNQAAGASELAARNFAEFAAASGLNSGAGGQAELARNVTLQDNLNDLNQGEADFYSNIEMQKAQAEMDYNNAIAEAQANNDYARAQALYQEKVRVQEELRQQELQQIQLDMQQYQIAQQQQQYQDSIKASDRQSLADYGAAFLQQGLMPSDEMLSAMGITANDAQSYINSMTRVDATPTLTYSQMMDAINNGQLTPNVLSAYEYYMGTAYTPQRQTAVPYIGDGDDNDNDNDIPRFSTGYDTQRNTGGMKGSEWDAVRQNLLMNLRSGNTVAVDAYMDQIAGGLSKAQWNELADLMRQYGYSNIPTY